MNSVRRSRLPSAFASSLVLFPARLESNTIQRESGDQEDSSETCGVRRRIASGGAFRSR